MKAREFAYWLQGYFELAGSVSTFSSEQRKVVRNHLNLTKDVEGKLDSFGSYAEGWLDLHEAGNGITGMASTPEAVGKLRERLGQHFRDEIDPSYGADRERLQRIHDGQEAPKPVVPVSIPGPTPPRRRSSNGDYGSSGRIMCEDKTPKVGDRPLDMLC